MNASSYNNVLVQNENIFIYLWKASDVRQASGRDKPLGRKAWEGVKGRRGVGVVEMR